VNETLSRAIFDSQVQGLTERLFAFRGWSLFAKEYPVLDVAFEAEGRRPLRVRFDCTGWNQKPTAVKLLTLEGHGLTYVPQDATGVINPGPHPISRKPFVCLPGTREYHAHIHHFTDRWENYRDKDDFSLGGILTKIWRTWGKAPGWAR
jgi:hypothetical protein